MEFALFDPITCEVRTYDLGGISKVCSLSKKNFLKLLGDKKYFEKFGCYILKSETLTESYKTKLMNRVKLNDEIWVKLDGELEGYQVSNYGRVIGKKGKLLKPRVIKINRTLFAVVGVRKKGKNHSTPYKVKRMVSKGFDIPKTGDSLIYIDRNCWNNRLTNLKYVKNGYQTTRMNRSRRKPIAKLDIQTKKIIDVYSCAAEAADELLASRGNIAKCCRDNKSTAYGFRWKYITHDQYEGY